MEILSGLGKFFSEAGQEVAEQTGKLAEKARISSKINSVEKALTKELVLLGKEYYKEHHKTGSHPSIEEVTALRQELRALQEELSTVHGVRSCPQCDCQVGTTFSFCQHCGCTMTGQDKKNKQDPQVLLSEEDSFDLEEGSFLETEYYES